MTRRKSKKLIKTLLDAMASVNFYTNTNFK